MTFNFINVTLAMKFNFTLRIISQVNFTVNMKLVKLKMKKESKT